MALGRGSIVQRAFATERDLVDALIDGLPSLLALPGGLLQAREVTHDARVVDVVAILEADDLDLILASWEQPLRVLGRLSRAHLTLLAVIWAERRISLRRLAHATWTPEDVLASGLLRDLCASGLVDVNSRGTCSPTGWAQWSPGRIVAIEAKLTDWKQCLEQAAETAVWADLSYTAFPAPGPLDWESVRAALTKRRIGGLAVSPLDGPSLVVKAASGGPASRRRRAVFALALLRDLVAGKRWTSLSA